MSNHILYVGVCEDCSFIGIRKEPGYYRVHEDETGHKVRLFNQDPLCKEPLRICSRCGLEAHDENDLVLFVKLKGSSHGRGLLCKRCDSEKSLEYQRRGKRALLLQLGVYEFD